MHKVCTGRTRGDGIQQAFGAVLVDTIEARPVIGLQRAREVHHNLSVLGCASKLRPTIGISEITTQQTLARQTA